jgi:hypothetical protein
MGASVTPHGMQWVHVCPNAFAKRASASRARRVGHPCDDRQSVQAGALDSRQKRAGVTLRVGQNEDGSQTRQDLTGGPHTS